jgi:hypothetical protein
MPEGDPNGQTEFNGQVNMKLNKSENEVILPTQDEPVGVLLIFSRYKLNRPINIFSRKKWNFFINLFLKYNTSPIYYFNVFSFES